MRKLGGMFMAMALGASLAACGSQGSGAVGPIDVDPKGIEAHITKLAGETFTGTSTEAADFEAVRALLPPEVAMTWGNLSFDEATKSTLITDLRLTPADMPTVGLQISELRLWDFDAKLLQDRIAGQRLDETASLVRRIDAKNVALFGVADAIMAGMGGSGGMMPDDMDDMMPAPEDDVDGSDDASPIKFQPSDWPDASEPDMDFYYGAMKPPTVERFELSIGRVILDDIQLKPYQVAPAPAAGASLDDPGAQLMQVLQALSAFSQSYGIDTAAYMDFKFGFGMTQFDEQISGDMTIAAMGGRGMRGGDLDGMFVRDVNYLINAPTDEGMPFNMQYNLGLMTLEDLRLGKVFAHLAKGAVPPRTESDLMSLGVWRSEKEAVKFAGKDFYTVESTMFDGTGFHWFIPTKLSSTATNATLDVSAFMDFVAEIAEAQSGNGGDPFADPFDDGYGYNSGPSSEDILAIKALIDKHGFSKMTFNSGFGWNWNAGNGETKLDFSLDGKDLLKIGARYEGGFPSFKAVSDVIPDNVENTNPMAVQNVFSQNSSLKLVELTLEDKGGLPKIYGLVGELAPAMGMGGAPMTAENVRMMAASGLKTAAAAASQQIPEIPGLLTPVANFLEQGGKLRMAVQPAKAMPFANFESVMMGVMMGASTPSQIIKDFGIKTEHSK